MLEVARVGVWLFDEDRGAIRCVALHDRGSGGSTDGLGLRREDAPQYFEALESERALVIEDVRADPLTAEMRAAYLEPQGVIAMLDAPIVLEGRPVGVVCHEHVGGPREWTTSEMLFSGSIADFASMAIQADENRRARAELEARKQDLELALRTARMATWSWDIANERSEWSERMGPLFGRPPGWNPRTVQDYYDTIHPDDREWLKDKLQETLASASERYYLQYRSVMSDGTPRWLESHGKIDRAKTGAPLRMWGAVMDITPRKALEEQLLQAQKMDAVGNLAGGIAHDFNNLLSVIAGAADMVRTDTEDGTPLARDMDDILAASERAAALTQQLLMFARRQHTQPRSVELGASLESVHNLLRRVLGANIEIAIALSDEALVVWIDPIQLEQVLVNLAVNARDAMPHGGRLQITTARVPGEVPQVALRVRDNGVGMSEEVQRRAFEPFFTTKERGRGTGLGLSSCYGIVQKAGGDMRISSRPGHGTEITVLLPEHDAPPDSTPASGPQTRACAGTERVLLVEDEPLLRRRAARALRDLGYEVTATASAVEARALAQSEGPYDLLITDVVMPEEGGGTLGRAFLEEGRTKAVLLISGYAFDALDPSLPRGMHFLAKPFRMKDLARKAREILDDL